MTSSYGHSTSSTGSLKTLSLLKFSYATNPNLYGRLLWTHLPQRDNLFAVFDHVICRDVDGQVLERGLFKILRGGEILEQLYLEDLISQSRLDEHMHHSQPLSDSSRVVIVIVKKPLIALRYQRPDNQIQRIQMNFLSESGYDIALNMFISLGLPIRDKNAISGERSTQPEPLATQYSQSQRMEIYPEHRMARHLPAKQSSSTLYTSGIPTFATNARTTVLSGPEDYRTMQPLVHAGCAGLYQMNQTRPVSSSTLKSQHSPSKPGPFVSTHMQKPPFVPRIHTSDGRLESFNCSNESHLMPGISFASDGASPDPLTNPTRRTLFEREINEAKRPATAPILANEDSINDLLPPKRILPFPTPAVTKKHVELEAEKVKSNLLPEGEITSTNVAKVPKMKSTAKSKRAKSNITSVVTESTLSSSIVTSTVDDPIKKPTGSAARTMNQISSAALNVPGKKADVHQPLGSPNSNDTYTHRSTTKTTPKTLAEKGKAILQDQVEITEEFTDRIDNFVKKHGSHPAPVQPPTSDLAKYASMPEPERLAALDAFILDLVCNENFATLCEDVEKSWRRIGLDF